MRQNYQQILAAEFVDLSRMWPTQENLFTASG